MKFDNLEKLMTTSLKLKTFVPLNKSGSGCINQGDAYFTDIGNIFIKTNNKDGSDIMFEGEYASLYSIYITETIKVPKPIKVVYSPTDKDIFLVMEFIGIERCKHQKELGEKLAELHMSNIKCKNVEYKNYVSQFGFNIATCCGFIPQNNNWNDDWIDFFVEQRLQYQIDLMYTKYKDQPCLIAWNKLKPYIKQFFLACPKIEPSLLHGDLWGGNIGETFEGEPIIFDPAAFYGHHEYDLGIAGMFGGFTSEFYNAYHKIFPRTPGFEERQSLYQLFHYLNHWNHFGLGYRASALNIINSLTKKIQTMQ